MKKSVMVFFSLVLAVLGAWGLGNFSFATAESFYYEIPNSDQNSLVDVSPDTDIGGLITKDAVKQNDGLLQKLMIAFNLDTADYQGSQKAFYYLRKLLNYGLGFVSLIAFGLLLYSFYMMLIGDGEKGWTQVKTTLKGIVIALVMMSLSWLIVSMIFWSYEQQKDQTFEEQSMGNSLNP